MKQGRIRRWRKWAGIVILGLGIWLAGVAGWIAVFGGKDRSKPSDCAIVLGAAAYGNKPSPVFAERINHAVELHRSGTVKYLLFTGGRVTSAYFVLRNPSAAPVRLVGAESPRAGRIEIHAHDMQGGMMRMRQRAFIDVPANGSVRFAPGGLHLMLMELRGELIDRQPVQLTLLFEGGARQALTLPVCSVMRERCP